MRSDRPGDRAAVDRFIDDIEAVCRKHDMVISHEDGHGAFIVELKFDEHNITWLRACRIEVL